MLRYYINIEKLSIENDKQFRFLGSDLIKITELSA